MSNIVEHSDFELGKYDKTNSFTLFPIVNTDIYKMYKDHLSVFWTVEEVDLFKDRKDWEKLNANEQTFIRNILAFFAASDGIVSYNLDLNFSEEIDIKEVKLFYHFQTMMEDIHSEMYSVMIDTFIKDSTEKEKHLMLLIIILV